MRCATHSSVVFAEEDIVIELKTRGTLEKIARLLEAVVYPLSKGLSVVSMVAVCAMMFLVVADVFMRRALNQPILGSYEIGKVLLTIVAFCAAAYIMTIKGHVIVDILIRLYPKKLQVVISGIALVLSLAIIGLICWQSVIYGVYMLQVGERSVLLRIPTYPFIFVVAFGSAVLFLVILVQFLYILGGKDGTA